MAATSSPETEASSRDLQAEALRDDDDLVLSSRTLAALQEFKADQQRAADAAAASGSFSEDWRLSQFWYTEHTARTVARAVVRAAGAGGAVACVACPSVFKALRTSFPRLRAQLLEYDARFQALGCFSQYDYREPHAVGPELHGAFDVVVADPPYLAAECLEKTALTMRLLARAGRGRLVLLTGAVMRPLAHDLLGLRPVAFRPAHEQKLANEFELYTNAEDIAEGLGGWDGYAGNELASFGSTDHSRSSQQDTGSRQGHSIGLYAEPGTCGAGGEGLHA